VLVHRLGDLLKNRPDVVDSVAYQCRGHHRDERSSYHRLPDVTHAMRAACNGKVGANLTMDNRDPVQPKYELVRIAQPD
jgi:hypothetical protein